MWRVRSPADGALPAGAEPHPDPTVTRAPLDAEDTTSRDSVLVSGGTAIARLTGVVRVVIIGAVLGPTTFGNAFQITNSLPNLIYYGFLAGSLVSTLLVPVLVRHLVAGDAATVPTVARGFLGLALIGTAATLPVMVLGLPWLLRLASSGTPVTTADEQVRLVTVLAILTAPQVLLYAVAGTGAAVMYAHRRFAAPGLRTGPGEHRPDHRPRRLRRDVRGPVRGRDGPARRAPAARPRRDGGGRPARRRPVVGRLPVRGHPEARTRLGRAGGPSHRARAPCDR